MTTNFLILIMVATNLLFGIGAIFLIIYLIKKIIKTMGSKSELIAAYKTNSQPEGEIYENQTIGLGGALRYRTCSTRAWCRAVMFFILKQQHPPTTLH